MSRIKEWQLEGIRKHTVIWFPVIRESRRETLEETLESLSSEERLAPNYSHFPRTTYLYKSDTKALQEILFKLKHDPDFISSDILHSASDLGLTHRIKVTEKSGSILFFDGLCIRLTRTVSPERLNLEDLLSKTGVPQEEWKIINRFVDRIREVLPDRNIESTYSYYTVDNTNWEKLGLERKKDAQICLVINDVEQKKDFAVYLGEEDRIHQMIAHDLFIGKEIEMFINFYDRKSKDIIRYQDRLKTDFGGIISSIWRVDKKHQMWNSVKKAMKSIYAIKDLVDRGKLFSAALKSLIEKKWAFFNGPRQLWLIDEVENHAIDDEEKIQHPTSHFFEIRLEGSKLKEIPDSPIDPFYYADYEQLKRKIQVVSDQVDEIYKRERDLLTAFQTEFSLYAVWISIIALIIAIAALLLH